MKAGYVYILSSHTRRLYIGVTVISKAVSGTIRKAGSLVFR